MAQKFTIKIAPPANNSYHLNFISHPQTVNSYGSWNIRAGSTGHNYLTVLLIFTPAQFQTAKALKDLKITVMGFKGTTKSLFTATAKQIGSSSAYEVETSAVSQNGYYNYNYNFNSNDNFELIIEIDASSLTPLSPPLAESTSLVGFTQEMFDGEKLADITIKTNNGKSEIKANKFILSRSPVFNAMLNRHDTKEAQEGVIKIYDIKHDVLKEMIRFMYTDRVPMIKQMALGLLIAADKYNLPGLFRECNIFLQANINITNFANILDISDNLSVADLKERAIKFIIENHDSAFDSADWKALKLTNVQLGMEVMERCFRVIYKNIQK